MPESELATSLDRQARTLLGHAVLSFAAGVWTALIALLELGTMAGVYVATFAGCALLHSAVQHRRSRYIDAILFAAHQDAHEPRVREHRS